MKLWAKGYQLDELVEKYMTGDDPQLDHALIPYDCLGSIAHAKMLHKIGILTADECEQMVDILQQIRDLAAKGEFIIQPEEEDVHTAVENYLIAKLGDIGKKLHTARSRNDQVLVDLRLYSKDQLLVIIEAASKATSSLCKFAQQHHASPFPGRTHFQRAMPSSWGLWALAFAESLLDDIELLKCVYTINDQCPLGSASSYGTSFPLDRKYCAELLGFAAVQNNVLYANNSRGKFEGIILSALVQVMNDLSKMSSDIIIFCAPEFGYVTLPEKYCPGSSLMPQKRNPCPLELIRAKSATLQGLMLQVLEITRTLPSGYNRDLQETKRPLMHGFELTLASLQVFTTIFSELNVDKQKCIDAFSPEVFATNKVLNLVKDGMPFRDAYKQVALNLDEVVIEDPVQHILANTHQGGTGNLGVELTLKKLHKLQQWTEQNALDNGLKNKSTL